MSKLSNSDHPIYSERGRLNRQIALVLVGFVIFVMIATVAKLGTGMQETTDDVVVTNEVSS